MQKASPGKDKYVLSSTIPKKVRTPRKKKIETRFEPFVTLNAKSNYRNYGIMPCTVNVSIEPVYQSELFVDAIYTIKSYAAMVIQQKVRDYIIRQDEKPGSPQLE